MYLKTKIKNVLRGMKQLWGGREIKRRLWDTEYGGGRWDHCERTPGAFVYSVVEKHCVNGSILDLGCGSGNTGNELDVTKYTDYTGIDISEVALAKAAARSEQGGRGGKNRYIQDDVISYLPRQTHDVILLRESIYYIPRLKIQSVLDRYATYLTDRGVFVVDVGENSTRKAGAILEIIERNYKVLEKHSSGESRDFVIVFRSDPIRRMHKE